MRGDPIFENIGSTTPEKYWLLWASPKTTIVGVICFFLALYLSLLITIPWSKHYWALRVHHRKRLLRRGNSLLHIMFSVCRAHKRRFEL
jgi:hypothetical protein